MAYTAQACSPQWKNVRRMATLAPSAVPPAPAGGCAKCASGSDTLQNSSPMPMPAPNIMAYQLMRAMLG